MQGCWKSTVLCTSWHGRLLMLYPGRAGALDSSKDMQKFALEAFPSYVTRLTAATLERFMASDPLRPKARPSLGAALHALSAVPTFARVQQQPWQRSAWSLSTISEPLCCWTEDVVSTFAAPR